MSVLKHSLIPWPISCRGVVIPAYLVNAQNRLVEVDDFKPEQQLVGERIVCGLDYRHPRAGVHLLASRLGFFGRA